MEMRLVKPRPMIFTVQFSKCSPYGNETWTETTSSQKIPQWLVLFVVHEVARGGKKIRTVLGDGLF
ncbi:hypothetical protein BG57_21140 [Caballeronia grimmiae]|uniref:Uncharacterized protein n=1 Tax=Caballeronia grimmiae TaxID=1071679 RepID=A0A069P6L3_9BURK|nr:hypothetical protein BG57_21140 [Caballeronia grimmiae]